MTNSIEKGKRGEREAVKFLKSLGYTDAQRTQQYNGLGLSDVICPESLPDLHIEVKFGYPIDRFDIGTMLFNNACKQAIRDSEGKTWCLLWKPKHRSIWRFSAEEWWYGSVLTLSGPDDIKQFIHEIINHENTS